MNDVRNLHEIYHLHSTKPIPKYTIYPFISYLVMALFWLSLLGKGYKGGKLKLKLKYLSMKVNHVPCYKKENRGILYSPSVKRSPYPAHPTESSCIVDVISITIIQVVSASHVCKYSNIGKVWSQDFLYSLLKLKISNFMEGFCNLNKL